MAGDLLQKFNIALPQASIVQRNVQKPAVPQAPAPTLSTDGPEYSAAITLAPANLTPLGVIPHSPTGYLVKENVFQSAGSTVKSYGKYAKYFYDAGFKGEGTDYSVGKINDLSIRAGSLGIAGILAATKMFPFAKGMEFVGLTTWFASMAIWPKVIAAPVKALYGVDTNQKYVDSYGRRKSFFEDPQYLPWDLYRHIDKNGNYNKQAPDYEYLNKIGDKLGVPDNIENRNEAIQNKIRQVSTQSNALWMLTAGVMTPVVSSIVADSLQKPLAGALENMNVKNAQKDLTKLVSKMDTLLSKEAVSVEELGNALNMKPDKQFEQEFSKYVKETLSHDEIESFNKFIERRYAGSNLRLSLKKEFSNSNIRQGSAVIFDGKLQDALVEASNKAIEKFKKTTIDNFKALQDKTSEFFLKGGIGELNDSTKIDEIVSKLSKPPYKKNFGTNNINVLKQYENLTFGELKAAIANADFKALKNEGLGNFKGLVRANIDIAVDAANYTYSSDGLREFGKDALVSEIKAALKWVLGEKNVDKSTQNFLSEFVGNEIVPTVNLFEVEKIDVNRAKKLLQIAEIQSKIHQKIDKYAQKTIADISESVTARNWEKLPKQYLELFGFNKAEITQLSTMDMRAAGKLLAQKMEMMVDDPQKLEKAVRSMSTFAQGALSKEQAAVLEILGTTDKPGVLPKLKQLLDKVAFTEGFGEKLYEGIDLDFKRVAVEDQTKFKNTVNSLGRPIKALDAYQQIDRFVLETLGMDAGDFTKKIESQKAKLYTFKEFSYEESKEALTKYMRRLVLENADINNWSTKHESKLEGLATGMKHSQGMNAAMADFIYGEFSPNIKAMMPEELAHLFEVNSQEMNYRFTSIFNQLLPHNQSDQASLFIKEVFDSNPYNLNADEKTKLLQKIKKFSDLFESKHLDLGANEIRDGKRTIEGFKQHVLNPTGTYDTGSAKNFFYQHFKFGTNNRKIAKQAGKDVTEFVIDAARDVRSRNKWTKLVWSLFGGTVALSAVAIAVMGRKNYFNKDVYTYKKDPVAGGNNDSK